MAKPTFSLPVIMDARTTKKLLDDEINRYGGLIWDGTIVAASDPTLAQQVRDDVAQSAADAQQSAADAQQSAADAALYDGPRFDTVTGFFSSTATFTSGKYVRTDAEGFAYKAVDTATASTVENAGGQNFEVLPGADGHNPIQWGAPADGVNYDNAATQKMFNYLNSLDEYVDGAAKVIFPTGRVFYFDTTSPVTSQRGHLDVNAYGATFTWSGDGRVFNLGAQVDQDNLVASVPSDFTQAINWRGGFFNGGVGNLNGATAVAIELGITINGSVSDIRARRVRRVVNFAGLGNMKFTNITAFNYNYVIYNYAAGDALLLAQDCLVLACGFSIGAAGTAPNFDPYAVYCEGQISGWTLQDNTCAVDYGGLWSFPTGATRGGFSRESHTLRAVSNFCEQNQNGAPYIQCRAGYGGVNSLEILGGVYPGHTFGGTNIEIDRIGSLLDASAPGVFTVRGVNFQTEQATAITINSGLSNSDMFFSENTFNQRAADGGKVFSFGNPFLFAHIGQNSYADDSLSCVGLDATYGNVDVELDKRRTPITAASTVDLPFHCGFIELQTTSSVTVNTITAPSRGHRLLVTFVNSGITLAHGTGNIQLSSEVDFTGSTSDVVELFYNGSNWQDLFGV